MAPQKLGYDQIQIVALFAVALGNCGVKAAHDGNALARAADFLPMIKEVPGLLSLKAADVKAQFQDLDQAERQAVYTACAAKLELGDKDVEAKAGKLLDAGLKIVEGIAEAVAAIESAPAPAGGAAA